uniref:Uncharacterized protein n=1 Tax=Brassica campestris TaxID=3711 RepID=M4CBA3_BRACM
MNMQDINHCEIKLRIQSFDFDAYCQNMSKTEVSSLSQRSSSANNIASETEEDKCESSQKRRRVENNSESEDPPER